MVSTGTSDDIGSALGRLKISVGIALERSWVVLASMPAMPLGGGAGRGQEGIVNTLATSDTNHGDARPLKSPAFLKRQAAAIGVSPVSRYLMYLDILPTTQWAECPRAILTARRLMTDRRL